ncbi:MAG: hypothetical protein JW990_01920 [Thermoleophilia bacterium]|nr:hypothetical protein [Thermoleophilia bacterium]
MNRSWPLSRFVVALLALVVLGLVPWALGGCGELSSDSTAPPPTTVPTTGAPGSTAAPATASTSGGAQSGAGNILFFDDFQDGDSAGWQVEGAWVVQQDGDLYTFATSGEGYAFVPAGVGWREDYALRTSYLLEQGALGLSFCTTLSGRYYVAVDEDLISLVKAPAAGDKTVLAQAAAPEPGVRHYLTIARQGGTIQVYVDRTLWLAATDGDPLVEGTIMVGSAAGTTAWVDDVMVNRVGIRLPSGAPEVAQVDPADVVVPEDEAPDLAELPDPDEDVDELPEINHPMDIPLPVVTFTGIDPNDPGSRPSTELALPEGGAVVKLEWDAHNIGAAFLNQEPVANQGEMTFLVTQDYNYELEVIGFDQQSYSYYVSVTLVPADGEGDDGDGDDGPDDNGEGVHGPDPAITCQVVPSVGTEVTIHIRVRNQGDMVAESARVRWRSDEASGVTDREGRVTVAPCETAYLDWRFTYDSPGSKNWSATVDTDPFDADIDTSNNYTSRRLELTL